MKTDLSHRIGSGVHIKGKGHNVDLVLKKRDVGKYGLNRADLEVIGGKQRN